MVNLFELDLVDSVLDLLFCLLKPEMFIEWGLWTARVFDYLRVFKWMKTDESSGRVLEDDAAWRFVCLKANRTAFDTRIVYYR